MWLNGAETIQRGNQEMGPAVTWKFNQSLISIRKSKFRRGIKFQLVHNISLTRRGKKEERGSKMNDNKTRSRGVVKRTIRQGG